MNKYELNVILDKHRDWLFGEEDGERADLSYANLRGTYLRGAYLRGADLSYANLRGADLSYASLSYANLSYANLSYANLSYANLRGANLSYANLRGADLRGAYLRGANLRGADTQCVIGLKIVSVDNIGTYNGKSTYIPKYDVVFAGCWTGTLEKFLIKGKEMNENNPTELKNIELAYELFKNAIEEEIK